MAACADCEEALSMAGSRNYLVPFQGTRIAIVACERHIRQVEQAFGVLNAFYDASYQEAISDLTSELLNRRTTG